MADLEKVIKGLECCTSDGDCRSCVYWNKEMGLECPVNEDALELLQRFRWIPVSEQLPETGERVLAITESKYCYIGFYSELSGWHFPYVIHPTHWMPLPQPPQNGR